jgi:uncharacterized OB-fold protein
MVETVVKKFYDGLAKGKITGARCKECGKWTFPPVTACRECGSRKIELKRINGEGTVYFYSTSILPPKKFARYSPYAYGLVVLKEGPSFMTMIEGLDASTPEKIAEGNKKLPLKVKAKVAKKAGMNIVVFRTVK